MEKWLTVLVLLVAACSDEPPACGTSLAETIFVETALDAYDHAFGPTAQATGSCPGGGTSTVDGTSGPTNDAVRVDAYTVTFADCATLDARIVLNGTVQLQSTWLGAMNAAYCSDCKVTSSALAIRGTEEHCDEPHIERTCAVSFTVEGTAADVPQRYDGSICDVTFP